jgi:hypothetical protein
MADDADNPGKWKPGQSGNPRGKPKGARNHVLLALDKIGGEAAQAVLEKAVEAAKGGDARAAELILSRVWPARKGRPVALTLPPVLTAADLPAALAAVVAAAAAGDLTTEEAAAVAGVLDMQRKAIETADIERRLAALEAAANERT